MTNRTFFYIRVSTTQQGRSGLGIEAQRRALQHFAQTEGIEVLGEYVEVETGKGTDALDRIRIELLRIEIISDLFDFGFG